MDDPRSEPRVLHELTQNKMAEDAESDIAIRFVDENDSREISAKAENSVQLIALLLFLDCKTVGFFSKSVKKSAKRGVRVLYARGARASVSKTLNVAACQNYGPSLFSGYFRFSFLFAFCFFCLRVCYKFLSYLRFPFLFAFSLFVCVFLFVNCVFFFFICRFFFVCV